MMNHRNPALSSEGAKGCNTYYEENTVPEAIGYGFRDVILVIANISS